MKYNLYINQVMAVKLGMKNVNQAIIFDLLTNASTWAEPIRIDEKLYWWVSRQYICRQLELLSMRPDTAYRHLKGLAELKLIDYQKEGKKDCIAITELGRSYIGNKSEKARKEIRKDSEKNPTYNTFSDNTKDYYEEKLIFDKFRKSYPKPKSVRGLDYEFEFFIEKHKDWKEILPILDNLNLTLATFDVEDSQFVPGFERFIGKRHWEKYQDQDEDNYQPVDHKTQEENVKAAKEEEYKQYLKAKQR